MKIESCILIITVLGYERIIITNGRKVDLDILDSSRYLSLAEQYRFLENLSKLSPHSMRLEIAGNTSIRGKPFTIRIPLVSIGDKRDPIMFFDCGIHAREWISSATCLFLIQKLVLVFEMSRKLKLAKEIPENSSVFNYQWQFMPMLNPDGYLTSHWPDLSGERVHRMHRKNRRPPRAMNMSEEMQERCDDEGNCEGVDLNRNFPAGWGLGHKDFKKDSKHPWESVYKGSHPISEPESLTLHSHLSEVKQNVLSAISIHSYGKDIYYPKGWLSTDHPEQIQGKEKKRLREFAEYFNQALGFRLGSVGELLPDIDLSGGATDDYYWSVLKINLTYTVELDPDLSQHKVGFQLPPENIKPVGMKMWKAIKLMAEKMDKLYPHLVKH